MHIGVTHPPEVILLELALLHQRKVVSQRIGRRGISEKVTATKYLSE